MGFAASLICTRFERLRINNTINNINNKPPPIAAAAAIIGIMDEDEDDVDASVNPGSTVVEVSPKDN